MPEAIPPKSESKAKTPWKQNRKLIIGIGVSVGCLVILVIILLIAFFLLNKQSNSNPESGGSQTPAPATSGESSETIEPVPSTTPAPVVATADTVYYIKSNNIYAYDFILDTDTQLTNFVTTDTNYVNIANLNQINTNTLGFSKCVTVTGDFGCGVFSLNLTNSVVTEMKHLNASLLLMDLRFDTTTRFAYIAESSAVRSLILNTAGAEQTLEDVAVQPYGRGGFEGDAQHIQFSPNHSKLLQISTSSARSSMDFNTYIYNLATPGQPPTILADSTHPIWLNNNHILYLGYQQSGGGGSQGFKVFDISATTSSTFSTAISTTNVYSPGLSPDGQQVLYTKFDNKEIWLYDIPTDTTSLLLTEAVEAVWVDATHLAVSKVHSCLPGEICNSMTDYEYDGVGIYDLDTSSYVADIPGADSVYNVATLYN